MKAQQAIEGFNVMMVHEIPSGVVINKDTIKDYPLKESGAWLSQDRQWLIVEYEGSSFRLLPCTQEAVMIFHQQESTVVGSLEQVLERYKAITAPVKPGLDIDWTKGEYTIPGVRPTVLHVYEDWRILLSNDFLQKGDVVDHEGRLYELASDPKPWKDYRRGLSGFVYEVKSDPYQHILFLNDCNGHEYDNPYGQEVTLSEPVDFWHMKRLEYKQLGVLRRGGSWSEILEALQKEGITAERGRHGRRSEFDLSTYQVYNLLSGNY